jgi:hypothetical protein
MLAMCLLIQSELQADLIFCFGSGVPEAGRRGRHSRRRSSKSNAMNDSGRIDRNFGRLIEIRGKRVRSPQSQPCIDAEFFPFNQPARPR